MRATHIAHFAFLAKKGELNRAGRCHKQSLHSSAAMVHTAVHSSPIALTVCAVLFILLLTAAPAFPLSNL